MWHCMGSATTRTLHEALRLRRHARASRLPEFDRLKEELAYLKLLQGIAVVTFISLAGWLVSASTTASALTVVLAIVGVALLGAAVVALHRQIGRRINEIRKA
jgi:uncharacterized membrane protein